MAGVAAAQQQLYVHGGSGDIFRIDNYASSPTPVLVGTAPILFPADLAVDDASGDFYFLTFGFGGTSNYWRVDANTFATTQIAATSTLVSHNALDIALDGTMYSRSSVTGVLATVDRSTGTVSIVTQGMPAPTAGDLAIDVDGSILATNSLGRLDRYDVVTGAASDLGTHTLGAGALGIEVDEDGTIYVFTSDGDLWRYDAELQSATHVGSTGLHVLGCAFRRAGERGGVGTSYCNPSVTNSTGWPAVLSAAGSALVSEGRLRLRGYVLPLNSFAMFIASRDSGFAPNAGGSTGTLCLGGAIGRFVGPGQIRQTGGSGVAALDVDLSALPQPAGFVAALPGETWHFQLWFRDSSGGMPTSNFSDGLRVDFM